MNYIFGRTVSVIFLLTLRTYVPSGSIVFAISSFASALGLYLNCFPVRLIGKIQRVGGYWMLGTALLLSILIPSVAPRHQSPSYIFASFNNNSASSGLRSKLYLYAIGVVMSQRVLIGYQSVGFMSEEIKNVTKSGPLATVLSTLAAMVSGMLLILALTLRWSCKAVALDVLHQ